MGDILKRTIIRWLSKHVDRHDSRWPKAGASCRLNRGTETVWVDIERIIEHVDKDRRGADKGHDLRRRRECECWAKHGITWAYLPRHQPEKQGIGSIATG